MSKRWVLVAIVVGLVGVLAAAVIHEGEAREPDEGWPANFAHRGASTKAPENTLEAFRLAVEDGAGGLELDVHMTSDGVVAVIHDDSVDRTTGGSGLVWDMTLREVQGLDGGYRFTPDGGDTYPYRGGGVRVPELGEVLREFPDQRVNIDIKEARPGVEAAVLKTITEAGAGNRVLVVSEVSSVLERFRELSGGGISTGASRREIEKFYVFSMLRLESLLRPSYDALQVPVSFGGKEVVTPRFMEAAHKRGMRVDVWTIDDPTEMRRLLDLGADVVMTNRPEALEEVVGELR